jgi:hypothetical protein
MRRLMWLCALALTSCVDIYRGAIVQMNLRSIAVNADGQHYELFAVVNGGAVSVARFKVLDSIDGCGQDPLLFPKVKLVQAYDDGMDAAARCDPDGRLGTVDLVDTSTGTLLGGVRVDTAVDLSAAERVFVTVEADGEADPRPGEVVLHADVARGTDPFVGRQAACLDAFCDATPPDMRPAPDPCASRPEAPRTRRGVLLGTLVRLPAAECGEVAVGEVAIVPAEDETFL